MMTNEDPTCIMKMIKDLRSGSSTFRRDSAPSIRLSSAAITPHSTLESDNDECVASPKRPRLDDSVNSTPNSTLNKSAEAVGSPWEWRRLKGEVVSLRTRLSHQEAAVQQHRQLRRQMEEMFEKEKNILEMKADQDKQTINQLEARIDVARRTVQEAKEAQAQAERELHQIKANLEQKTVSVLNENAKLMEDLRNVVNGDSTSSAPKDISSESSDTALKLEAAEARIAQLEENLRELRDTRQKFELQTVELQTLQFKIEKLESERALWEEGKALVGRAARVGELEKELNAAKETIAAMRESVKGKLLLEEQISNVMQRLEHTEKVEQQVATLEADRTELLARLSEYESIGIDGGPQAVKRELNRLQQAEAILTEEEGQLRSKMEASQRECQILHRKYEEAKKIATELTESREKLNRLVSRLQKKMILVTRERDSYRQQLDMYEKEMTMVEGNSNVIAERIPALERTIEGYKDLVNRLESDLAASDDCVQKAECQKLREEIERLKGELEHRALKGDFNCNARILHFKFNPAAAAEAQAEEKQQALLREVEELRARVAIGDVGTGSGISSLQSQEIAELKQSYEIKITRLKDAFKLSSQEFRQACYQLFGWRVDRTKEGRYKLFSQYAESPDDYLFFKVSEDGVQMLETPFSATLGPLIERPLQGQHSVPMFLIAVQTELFNQQTMAVVEG